jgi:hypothetical protein
MTTNILTLPSFNGAGTSFSIATNADWFDSIFFIAPGSPPSSVAMLGQITNASSLVTVTSTAELVPGLPINAVPGIEDFAYVGEIISAIQFRMVDVNGVPVSATINDAQTKLVFQPMPLDLTGIEFRCELRSSEADNQVFLSVGTSDGTLLNGGLDGTLGFNVPRSKLEHLSPRTYVMDIVALADDHTINMFPAGPGSVVVTSGVTNR